MTSAKEDTNLDWSLSEDEMNLSMKDRLFILATKGKPQSKGLRVTTTLALLGVGPTKLTVADKVRFLNNKEEWNLEKREEPSEFVMENIIDAGVRGEKKVLDFLVSQTGPDCHILFPKTTSVVERYSEMRTSVTGLPDAIMIFEKYARFPLYPDLDLPTFTPLDKRGIRVLEIKTPYLGGSLASSDILPYDQRVSHILELKKDPYYCLSHILQALMYSSMVTQDASIPKDGCVWGASPAILYNVERYAAHRFSDPRKWIHVLDLGQEIRPSCQIKMLLYFKSFIADTLIAIKTNETAFIEAKWFERVRKSTLDHIKFHFLDGIMEGGVLSRVFPSREKDLQKLQIKLAKK